MPLSVRYGLPDWSAVAHPGRYPRITVPPTASPLFGTAVAVALTALVYLGVAALELVVSLPLPPRGTLWWAGGWGVAAVSLFGRRAVVGVLLGEWLTACGLFHLPWWLGLMTGVGNGLEAIIGAWVLRRWGFRPGMDRRRDVAVLGLASALAPMPVLAFQGLAGWLEGWYADKPVWPDMAVWWANDALATVYVVPFAAACVRWSELRAEWGGRWLTLVGLLGGFAGVTVLAFGTGGGHWQAGLTATAFPFLAWAVLRFGPRTTTIALAVYTTTIVVCVARRLDPFPDTGSNSCFPFLHLLLAVIAGTAHLLAAVSAERAAAERRALRATRWEGLAALAGGLAHDLNNRLTVVVGSVELARELLPPGHAARPLLASASSSVDQMARLTNDLLVYSGQGLRSPSRPVDPVDVVSVVRDAAAEVPGAVEVLATPADGSITVPADPSLLQLAVRHLIVNGHEAADGEPGRVTVSVDAVTLRAEDVEGVWPSEGRPGRYVRVRVSDTGGGMPPEVAQRMFEPFYTTKFPGRGIGLAVVAGVTRRAGGHIRVASTVGVGTTVELLLPLP